MRRRPLGMFLAITCWFAPIAHTDEPDDLARELPRIPATEANDALDTFRIHPGFRLEQVAAEPLVTDPVSACYDADGRLYVVEMRGYPYPENVPSGNVTLLEDADGDGHFDKRTIFLDGLSWPTSVVPYDGGVFIAVAPEILYAKDTDGDGKADVRRTAFRGFGTQNVQALVNGLLWGPDGWIYGVGGGNGGDITNTARPDDPAVSIRGRDFRFKPDGSAFEAISGGGQFGHSFDDWGRRFTCNNSNSIRQIVLPSRYLDRNPNAIFPAVLTDIAVEGGAGPVFRISQPEPWRVVRTRQRLADPAISARLAPTEKFAFGFFTSATGVTIYRGTAFPDEYQGNAFIGDVGGNLVHRDRIEPNGAILRACRADEGTEFLASTDNWFRPVNFANTPGGTLLVLDMYRETIEHPESIPEPIKRHLDLTSGHDRGRLYEVVPDGFRRRPHQPLSRASIPELVVRLNAPDAWWRETAQRLLIERRDPEAVPLLKKLAAGRPTALGRLHALNSLDALGSLAAEDVLPALTDPEPGVRENAARLAERFAAGSEAIREALIRLADDPEPMVRFQVALSLGEVPGPAALGALERIVRRDAGDPWTRAAVLSSVAGRADALLDRLAADPEVMGSPGVLALAESLAYQVGAEARPSPIAEVVRRATADDTGPAVSGALLGGLGQGLRRRGGSLRDVAGGPGLDRLLHDATATARRTDALPESRVAAIRLLGLGPIDPALEVLPPLLQPREPAAVQLATIGSLSGLPDPRVGSALADRWKSLGPAIRREAIEALLARPDRAGVLLEAVANGTIPQSDIDPVRRQQLLTYPAAEVRKRAELVLAGPARADRGPVLATFRPALEQAGDRMRGRAVFDRTCSTCHTAEGRGHAVAPALETVAGRAADDLLNHILDPNREVAPAYLNYTIATVDGRVVSGLIADETAGAVTLKRAEGATDVVPRDQIEAMTSSGLSLMPENLETQLDPAAMADLLAYVRSLRPGG